MWQELIVKERTETALEEGLTAQAVSRERRRKHEEHSLLYKLQQMIRLPRHKESGSAPSAVVFAKQQN